MTYTSEIQNMTPEELAQAAEDRAARAETRAIELHGLAVAEHADVKRHRAEIERLRAVEVQGGAAYQRHMRLALVADIAAKRVEDRTTATGKADIPRCVGEAVEIVAEVERVTAGLVVAGA